MALDDMDKICGETSFLYNGSKVFVRLFLPTKCEAADNEYICRFSLEGQSLEYEGRSIGFDSMQALVLSLRKIGSFLEDDDVVDKSLIEWENGRLTFPAFGRAGSATSGG